MKLIGSVFLSFLILLISAFVDKDAVSDIMDMRAESGLCTSEMMPADPICDVPKRTSEEDFCNSVNQKFRNYSWYSIRCNPKRWNVYDHSNNGNPLFYQEFGFDDINNKGPVNLILCGVHGDEPPSIYMCFQLTRHILFDKPEALKNFKAVIAPIVNPDGFFANTRQNGNGIDVNRNLPTEDWDAMSHKIWARYKKDPRKYPGARGGSEPESRLQTYLIDRYKPDKIISVHAPLGFLDYDGPGDQKNYNLIRVEQRARYLGLNIEANSKRFVKFVDYRFFPGSLGNYAGNEREIPTYTVELPTVRHTEAHRYWSTMRYALIKALKFQVYDGNETNPFFEIQDITQQAVNKDYHPRDSILHDIDTDDISRIMVKAGSDMDEEVHVDIAAD